MAKWIKTIYRHTHTYVYIYIYIRIYIYIYVQHCVPKPGEMICGMPMNFYEWVDDHP